MSTPTPPKREYLKATFDLEKNSDTGTLCLLCGKSQCEFSISARLPDRHILIAIHERCVAPYAVEGTRSTL